MDVQVNALDPHNQEILGTHGPILIRVFRGESGIAQVDRGREIIDQLLERWPTAGLFAVAHHGAILPDGAARRYTSRTFGAYGDRLIMAQVVLGLGFWSDAARGTAAALARLFGVSMPVEASVEAGARKLAREFPGVDPQQLIAAHDQLLAQLDASRPS